MSVAWVGAGIAAVGVVSGASASKKAAKAQQQSAADADATQLKMFNQSRADQAPWRAYGEGGLNELAYRLGISPQGSAGAASAPSVTKEQIRSELLPSFTKTSGSQPIYNPNSDFESGVGWANGVQIPTGFTDAETSIDEAGLNAAIERRMAQQGAARPGQQNDPNFGSLLRDFSLADFEKDPGYDFRMAEGMKGITNSAAARGGLLSGAALKAAGRYNQDFASNEFGNAYNRFNNNKTNQFNRLASLAGVGQQAATQIGNQGIATGQSMAQNQIGAGNARASGYIGQSNALAGGLSQGFNWWQQNQALNNSGNSMAGYNGAYSNLDYDVGNMS